MLRLQIKSDLKGEMKGEVVADLGNYKSIKEIENQKLIMKKHKK